MAYTGQVLSIPVGLAGLTGDEASENPAHLVRSENYEIRNNRVIRSFGLLQLPDAPFDGVGPVLGIFESSSSYDNTYHIVRGFNHHGPWGNAMISHRPTLDRPIHFVSAGREGAGDPAKVFVFMDTGLPLVSSAGLGPAPINDPPEEWRTNPPTTGAVTAGRLWAAARHRLYYSTLEDHEDFKSTGIGERASAELQEIEFEATQTGDRNDQVTVFVRSSGTPGEIRLVLEQEVVTLEIFIGTGANYTFERQARQIGFGFQVTIPEGTVITADQVFSTVRVTGGVDSNSGSGSINIFPGEGDRISAITAFRGLLVIWKYPRGLYTLDPRDTNPSRWSVRRISDKLGCVGAQGFAGIDQDIVFLDAGGGIHSLGSTDEFGDVSSSDLTQVSGIDEWMLENVDFNRLQEARMAYDELEKELHMILPIRGTVRPNLNRFRNKNAVRMIVDLNQQTPRFRINTAGNPTAIYVWRQTDSRQRVMVGMRNGDVYTIEETLRVGRALVETEKLIREPMKLKTSTMSFAFQDPRLQFVRKTIDEIEIRLQHEGDFAFDIVVEVDDGVREKPVVIRVDPTDQIAAVGDTAQSNPEAFILDESRLALPDFIHIRRRVGLSGENFSFRIEEKDGTDRTGLNPSGNFTILRFSVYFRISERLRSDA